jgi:hypothetical protein
VEAVASVAEKELNMAEEKEEEGWRTDNLPENVRLLMEWSHVNSGPTGVRRGADIPH